MNTFLLLVLIALAGGAGSIARVLLSGWIARTRSAEFGIWIVNLSGSFAIGLVFGGWMASGGNPEDWALLLVTLGFLGGFTTVSTFAVQVLDLMNNTSFGKARLLAVGSVLSCPALALVGLTLGTALGSG